MLASATPTTAGILSEECEKSMARLAQLSQCLQHAAPSNVPGRMSFGPNAAALRPTVDGVAPAPPVPPPVFDSERLGPLSITSNASEVASGLRQLGASLDAAVKEYQRAMESHFVTFYNHMRTKVEEENRVLRQTRTLVPTNPAYLKQLTGGAATAPAAPATARRPGDSGIASASEFLFTWLYIELESVMQTTQATRAAVYIRSSEGYLKQVLQMSSPSAAAAAAALPHDVGLASGTTLGTVVLHRIGINITKSRFTLASAPRATSDDVGAPPNGAPLGALGGAATQNGAGGLDEAASPTALRVTNAIILPLCSGSLVVGCLIICDKADGPFHTRDEHRAWAFTSAAHGVFTRYPPALLLSTTPAPDVGAALRAASALPPATSRRLSAVAAVQPRSADAAALLAAIPAFHSRQAIVRTGEASTANYVAKDVQALPLAEISEEDVLESSAPYIRQLESMWRKALDTVTLLRHECSKWDEASHQKSSTIIALEIQLRGLKKQFARLKNDVGKVKLAVPDHLMASYDIGGSSPAPAAEATTTTTTLTGAGHATQRLSMALPVNTNTYFHGAARRSVRGGSTTVPAVPRLPILGAPHGRENNNANGQSKSQQHAATAR